ncbi:MAG: phosphoglucosamine mutase [Ignavibacteria bacterium]|jgi:phosphomannomutase
MHEPIISISGIRGIPGKSLTPENITKFIHAFTRYTGQKRIVIGRDGRMNGEIIAKIVEAVLLFSGCEVIDLGIAPTPTIALAVETLKADGGISITASHNPQEWNGLKFMNSKGIFLDKDENAELMNFINDDKIQYVEQAGIRQVEYYPDFFDYHIGKVLNIKSVNLNKIRKRKFRVVVDCVNSSGSVIIPKLLKKLGCKVIPVDCDSSGVFTRKPEPVPENLKSTCKTVKAKKADMGIVVDPDADRLVIITEKGEPFGEENTITTAVNHVLKNTPVKMRVAVVNLSTSRSVDDVVSKLNGKLYKAPVGEINVIKRMKECGAVIGGEGSGGVILPEVHYGRDSLVGIALILSELAEFGGKVSEYKKTLPEYHILKTKIELKDTDPEKILGHVKDKYSSYPINEEDGLRIDFERSWVNFRKSNTEPIMRIITEAGTRKDAESLETEIISGLPYS